jgi:hypothetical protein
MQVQWADVGPTAVADDEGLAQQRRVWRAEPRGPSPTAVAGDEACEPDQTPAFADAFDDEGFADAFDGNRIVPGATLRTVADDLESDNASDAGGRSIAGDTVDSDADDEASGPAVARRLAPTGLVQGNPERHPSSRHNSDPEVGNFGLFFGNWGVRGTVAGNKNTEPPTRYPRSPNPEEPWASGGCRGGL